MKLPGFWCQKYRKKKIDVRCGAKVAVPPELFQPDCQPAFHKLYFIR
jgi:hypothetical protein